MEIRAAVTPSVIQHMAWEMMEHGQRLRVCYGDEELDSIRQMFREIKFFSWQISSNASGSKAVRKQQKAWATVEALEKHAWAGACEYAHQL